MFAFNLTRRIGEDNYLAEDVFIIERVRRSRALRPNRMKSEAVSHLFKEIRKHDRTKSS